jgi:hypothetical protein
MIIKISKNVGKPLRLPAAIYNRPITVPCLSCSDVHARDSALFQSTPSRCEPARLRVYYHHHRVFERINISRPCTLFDDTRGRLSNPPGCSYKCFCCITYCSVRQSRIGVANFARLSVSAVQKGESNNSPRDNDSKADTLSSAIR